MNEMSRLGTEIFKRNRKLYEAIMEKQELGMSYPTGSDLVDVLTERGIRYGKFTGHAEVTQMLKAVIASALSKRNKTLASDQQEAVDMILHKIGRIINGDADYADSWIDIAGYSKLVADRLEGVER